YVFRFRPATGRLEPAGGRASGLFHRIGTAIRYLPERFSVSTKPPDPQLAADGLYNPTFLAFHQGHRTLYSAEEGQEGAVSAFRVDTATGKLQLVNRQPSLGGLPCSITLDHTGKNLLVANFGGSGAVMPVGQAGALEDARLLIERPSRGKDHSHPHALV